jgi:hypothetical protein
MCELSVYMHGGSDAKRRYYMAMVTGMSVPLSDSKSTFNQTITDSILQDLTRTAASNRVGQGIPCFGYKPGGSLPCS